MARTAQTEDTFLCAASVLITASAADGGVEAVQVQRLAQRLRLHDLSVHGGARDDGVDAAAAAVLVGMNNQFQAEFRDGAVAVSDHFAELPAGIDMQQGERHLAWKEGLSGQMEQHG